MIRRLVLAAGITLLVGCTNGQGTLDAAPKRSTVSTEAEAGPATSATRSGPAATVAPAEPDGTAPAARPRPAGPFNTDRGISLWLGRGTMTDRSITLHWALDDRVEVTGYILHRLPFDPAIDPITVPLDEATVIHRSTTPGLVDSDVEAGAGYWYVLLATDSTGTEYRQAAEAHAVTDTEPPSPISGLVAEVEKGAITVSWDRSTDDYRFGRYSIRRSVDGATSIYYGTGWTADQTIFIDDRPPPTGSLVVYEVAASDFHGNSSEPSQVEVTAG